MLCSMEELEKHGFDEFEIYQYNKGMSLVLKCADYITNKEEIGKHIMSIEKEGKI